jgi:cysteine desulfurase
MEAEGYQVTYLPVKKNGLIDMNELAAAIRPDTALVSVMGVNNEIGVVQPLKEIGAVGHKDSLYCHSILMFFFCYISLV